MRGQNLINVDNCSAKPWEVIPVCDLPIDRLEGLKIGEGDLVEGDINRLAEMPNLKYLHLSRVEFDLSPLERSNSLETLIVHPVKQRVDWRFVNSLACLRKLSIQFSNACGFEVIDHPMLKVLELNHNSGLEELGDLARFRSLETLILSKQGRIRTLRSDEQMLKLRRVKLVVCRSLSMIDSLLNAPNLETFVSIHTGLDCGDFIPNYLPSSLKKVMMSYKEVRRSADAEAKLRRLGYEFVDGSAVREPEWTPASMPRMTKKAS